MTPKKDAYDVFDALGREAARLALLEDRQAAEFERMADELMERKEAFRLAEAEAVAVMEFNNATRCVKGDALFVLDRSPITREARVEIRVKEGLPDVFEMRMPPEPGPTPEPDPAPAWSSPAPPEESPLSRAWAGPWEGDGL